MTTEYNELLQLALAASREAAAEIMHVYLDPNADFGIERKADNSPLTRADKAAHQCIMQRLAPAGIPVLSEEGAQIPYEERREWRRLWVVDPLDGTKEFIKQNGEFTVNIALVEDGTPVLGVIYVPATKVFYCGAKGIGAWRGSDMHSGEGSQTEALPLVSRPSEVFTIVSSRSHMSPETEEYIGRKRKEHGEVQLTSIGSSLKICLVAEGTADEYPRFAPTMEWDTAAGDAIARAAGRQVLNALTSEPLTYNKADLHNPWFLVR